MKPCKGCGGEKAPGWNGPYCPPCGAAAAEAHRERDRVRQAAYRRRIEATPCLGCGVQRFYGQCASRLYCEACQPAPRVLRRAPAEPLRTAFTYSGMTKADVARALGWYRGGRPDTTRVARTLGRPAVNSLTAARMAPVLGLDPVDLGV